MWECVTLVQVGSCCGNNLDTAPPTLLKCIHVSFHCTNHLFTWEVRFGKFVFLHQKTDSLCSSAAATQSSQILPMWYCTVLHWSCFWEGMDMLTLGKGCCFHLRCVQSHCLFSEEVCVLPQSHRDHWSCMILPIDPICVTIETLSFRHKQRWKKWPVKFDVNKSMYGTQGFNVERRHKLLELNPDDNQALLNCKVTQNHPKRRGCKGGGRGWGEAGLITLPNFCRKRINNLWPKSFILLTVSDISTVSAKGMANWLIGIPFHYFFNKYHLSDPI